MDAVTRVDAGSSVIPIGESWESDPGGRSWGTGSTESY